MDTKLKKSKLIFSFAIFFLGMTLFLNSALSLFCLTVSSEGTVWDQNMDYQSTDGFRQYISGYLETFLSIAAGGESWKYYETPKLYEGEAYEIAIHGNAVAEIPQEEQSSAEIWEDEWEDEYWGYCEPDYGYWDDSGRYRYFSTKESYMENVSQNKNLRYAIVYQNKLLYTNIDGLEDRIGKLWNSLDFGEYLSPKEYNFSLWFNKDGDSKTRIFQYGAELDIYGNGTYSENKLWSVPGYSNFSVDAATKDAVIFLAAARKPELYLTGNYSEYGVDQYGGYLYSIYQNFRTSRIWLRNACILLGFSILLLFLAFLLRKQKRLAGQAIARLTGKLWLEGKILIFFLLPLSLFLCSTSETFSEILVQIRYGNLNLQNTLEAWYPFFGNGLLLTVCFWLFYFGVLDAKINKGQQKKPLIQGLRSGDLKKPVQKRMIHRYRLAAAAWLFAPLLCFLPLFLILPENAYLNWMLTYHPFPIFLFVLAYLALGAISLLYLKKNRRLAEDLGAFIHQVDAIREGDLTEPLILPADTDLNEAAESLNEIQHGLETALKEQLRSEQMKVELVTNVSHDIKTPLTSIISYVELLKQEEGLPEHVKEFIQILGEKSERLKTIVQDVFEVSKAASGQLPMKPEKLDLGKLLHQTLADMDTQIKESELIMKLSIPDEPVFVFADGQRLYRVFQNLIQNTLSYSLEHSRVFLTLKTEESVALAVIRNISASELDGTADFSERFVRGDASRTDGGSGLGLSIAKSFTEACGGTLRLFVDADLFTVTVAFPVCQDGPEGPHKNTSFR